MQQAAITDDREDAMPAALPGGPRRLNRATVFVLMKGGGVRTVAELARETGVHKGTLSKLLRRDATQQPSWETVEALLARFPLAEYHLLVVKPGEETPLEEYGLSENDVAEMTGTD